MFCYNYNTPLSDYLVIGDYLFDYESNDIENILPIQATVTRLADLATDDGSAPTAYFQITDNKIKLDIYDEEPAFNSQEVMAIKTLLTNNWTKFNYSNCYMLSERPDHYIEIDSDSDLFREIINQYNEGLHWVMNATLWVYGRYNFLEGCTIDFVNNAIFAQQKNKAEIENEIGNDKNGLFTYDNPPNPEDYWAEYQIIHAMKYYKLKDIKLYRIAGLDEIYCLECHTSEYRKTLVNIHLKKDNGIYRPFLLPDYFHSVSECCYIQ